MWGSSTGDEAWGRSAVIILNSRACLGGQVDDICSKFLVDHFAKVCGLDIEPEDFEFEAIVLQCDFVKQ